MPNYYVMNGEDEETYQVETLEDGRYRILKPTGEAVVVDAFSPEDGRLHLLTEGGQSHDFAVREVNGDYTVQIRGWDTHVGIAKALTFGYPPKLTALDQAVSALLDDIRALELEERVTICVASEFGRTPRLNPAAGRDHWPRAQSVLLAGAGIERGVVVGQTDPRGEEPIEREVSPADLHATLLSALGMDVEHVLHTPDGRPARVVPIGGAPITEALRS